MNKNGVMALMAPAPIGDSVLVLPRFVFRFCWIIVSGRGELGREGGVSGCCSLLGWSVGMLKIGVVGD